MSRDVPDAIRELMAIPQWVCWRYETRGGKRTKIPLQPSGALASSNDPATWATFDTARTAPIPYEGVGFVLSPEDPYAGIDLDHCITDDNRLWGWAELIVASFASYTEITPSGTGLRIWVRGRLPDRGRKKAMPDGGAIEVYDRGRFFTISGRHWPGTPFAIKERQGLLDEFMEAQFPPTPAPIVRPPSRPLCLSDQEILDRALRAENGAKFARLYRGEWEGDYPSQSEAEFALIMLLRFWWGYDAAAIDRMFRQSGLYRDEWDEKRGNTTLGGLNIGNAFAKGGEVYDPDRYREERGPRAPTPPTPPETTRAAEAPPKPEFFRLTDMGNAQRLAANFGRELRYTNSHGWLIWRKTRWEEDQTQAIVRRAKDTVRRIYAEASRCEDEAIRKAIGAWAHKSESAGKIAAMLDLARSEPGICVTADAFDADRMLLNCENGTIELATGRLREHRREELLTKQIAVAYDADATSPRWDQFIAEVTKGDTELAAYLQRAVGYSLTGDVREQNLFFLYGLGANGKTTFLTVIQRLLGDYAWTAAAGLLLEKKNEQHPTTVADLAGRRFVLCSEVGEGKRMAEELVKQMTGDHRITARKMHRDSFEFDPLYKLWLAANHKPIIKGTDNGIWRRIHTVPFTATFYDPDKALSGQPVKDPTLLDKLLAELPGILAWAVRGCLDWQRIGLVRPKAVLDATESYREEMDILGTFLADRCVVQPGVRAKAGDLYAAYQEWCQATGEHTATQTAFGRALTERGFGEGRDRTIGRFRIGIGLVAESHDDLRLGE